MIFSLAAVISGALWLAFSLGRVHERDVAARRVLKRLTDDARRDGVATMKRRAACRTEMRLVGGRRA